VRVGDVLRYGDAIITVDGAIRLLIGEVGISDGALPRDAFASSIQFVGAIAEQAGAHQVEIWSVDLLPWDNYYTLPARSNDLEAQYTIELAEFADAGDTVMSVAADGRLFFQSAGSGCVGNGTLATHLDGRFTVYDATLAIEACGVRFAYLNGRYEGFASASPGNVWDYDFVLWLLVSKSDVAVTMSAWPQY
jgi:hypothetical protein